MRQIIPDTISVDLIRKMDDTFVHKVIKGVVVREVTNEMEILRYYELLSNKKSEMEVLYERLKQSLDVIRERHTGLSGIVDNIRAKHEEERKQQEEEEIQREKKRVERQRQEKIVQLRSQLAELEGGQ